MIEQRLMTLDEFRQLYDAHMGDHFPADELKPFYIMEKAVRAGNYFPYGYYEDGMLLAYTCLIRAENYLLLDYFAVMEEGRGKGTGSEILSVLTGSLKEDESIFLEVEEPLAQDPAERDLQERRIRFYLRNGALDTAVRADVFHVLYRILTMGGRLREEDAEHAMAVLYHSILTDEMYNDNIFFRVDSSITAGETASGATGEKTEQTEPAKQEGGHKA